MSLCSNSGNSAITNQEDPYDVKEDSRGKSGSLHLSEEFNMTMRMRNDSDLSIKRMKLSTDELPPGLPSGLLQIFLQITLSLFA